MPKACITILTLLLASNLPAQRAFEANGEVISEDVRGTRTNLGKGFSPTLMSDGRVALLRGRLFDYGERFDCNKREARNWVSIYNPVTKTESTLFDRSIPFDGLNFCVFEQLQLSPGGSVLYLVSPVYATSGSLAIVDLARGSIAYVPGVNTVYVIGSGAHRGDLIYQRRVWQKSDGGTREHPAYPFIHARPDGQQIAEIADEFFTVGGNGEVPILRSYLRKIGGTITVKGHTLP